MGICESTLIECFEFEPEIIIQSKNRLFVTDIELNLQKNSLKYSRGIKNYTCDQLTSITNELVDDIMSYNHYDQEYKIIQYIRYIRIVLENKQLMMNNCKKLYKAIITKTLQVISQMNGRNKKKYKFLFYYYYDQLCIGFNDEEWEKI
jgi:hypothetical protein